MFIKIILGVLLLLPSSLFAQEVWSLEKCISYALENNIQIQQSNLQVSLAERNKTQQTAEFLPSVNASASNTYNFGQTIDPFTNQFATNQVRSNQLFISGNLNLFSGFQNWNSLAKSEYDLKASEKDTEKMRNDVSLNIATAYLQILFGKELLKNAENQREISRLQRERIKTLVDVGQMAQSSFLDIDAQLANDELQVVSAQNNLNLSYLQLFQLLQLPHGKTFEVEVPNFKEMNTGMLDQNPQAIFDIAVQRQPEIQAQEYRLKSAEKEHSIAVGARVPRLSLSGSYGSGYSGNNKQPIGDPTLSQSETPLLFFDSFGNPVYYYPTTFTYSGFEPKPFNEQLKDNLNKSVSLTLSIPIFNGLSTHTAVKRTQINNMNQKLQLDAVKNTLEQTIQRAYNEALAAMKQMQAAEKLVTSQEEAFKYSDIRYRQSLINFVEFTDAKFRLSNAQNDYLRAKYDFIFKTKVLDFYKGQPLSFK